MSDQEDEYNSAAESRSPSPEFTTPKSAPRKRKSDANDAGAASSSKPKKARTSKAGANSAAALAASGRDLVAEVLADPDEYTAQGALGEKVALLARYARTLEGSSAKKDDTELEDAVEKIRKAAYSGIKKQMKWRPSCKQGGAKWSYDGYCPDPEVFARLLGLDTPPKWKMKKFPIDEFHTVVGQRISAHARYHDLSITSDVNVRYNAERGELKFSGSYGI